jgi:putative membrane protein
MSRTIYVHGHGIDEWSRTLFIVGEILFWTLCVGGGLFLFRDARYRASTPWISEERLLFNRFARGEIDDDEYRDLREALRDVTPRPSTPASYTSYFRRTAYAPPASTRSSTNSLPDLDRRLADQELAPVSMHDMPSATNSLGRAAG